MKNPKHTPGPWFAERTAVYAGRPSNMPAPVLVKCAHRLETFFAVGEAEANASLMAAAPELLAWCELLLKQLKQDHPNNMEGIKEHVSNLISRAKGE